jgi:hypothetical protein
VLIQPGLTITLREAAEKAARGEPTESEDITSSHDFAEVFEPSSRMKDAHVTSLAQYMKTYNQSIEDPDAFWTERGKVLLANTSNFSNISTAHIMCMHEDPHINFLVWSHISRHGLCLHGCKIIDMLECKLYEHAHT